MRGKMKRSLMTQSTHGAGKFFQGGYSLVEMAIVVAIVGLLTAGFFSVYNVYAKTQRDLTTENNSSVITSALTNYLIQNGHYPCPARQDAQRTDADYGVAGECDPTQSGYVTVAVGACSGGYCEESGTTASSDFQNVGYYCATTNAGLNLTLSPPSGKQFVDVAFASYGLPTGSYSTPANNCVPNFTPDPTCNALTSVDVVRAKFKDRTSSTTLAVNDTAFGGNPCPAEAGTHRLYVALKYATTVSAATTTKVRRGMVPFRTLGIDEGVAKDGYGMRFAYAVTEPLATDSYKQDGGAITITDATHTIAQYAHYVIFSAGEDRKGVYTTDGQMPFPCPTGTLDTENCNTTADSSATYRYASFSTKPGATHFDDYFKYYTSTETPLWRVSDSDGFHIEQMNNNNVGVGMDPTATGAAMQVSGVINARQNSYAQQLCDASGNNCNLNGGDIGDPTGVPKLQCPKSTDPATYKYIHGIVGGVVECTDNPVTECPSSSLFVNSINGSGNISCQSIVGCPLTKVTICNTNDYTLPAAYQTATNTSGVMGTSRVQSYVCASNGTWQLTGATGYCNCSAVDEMTQTACNSKQAKASGASSSDGNSGRGNWTGNWYYHHVHTCVPTETDTSTYDHKDCVCSPTVFTGTQSCGTGYTGTLTRTEDWVCDSSTSGHYNGWTAYTGTCTCKTNQADSVTTQTCAQAGYGAGYNSGNVKTTKHWICDSSTSGHWDAGTTVDTCTCSAVKATPYTIGCTAPKVGTITMQQTYNCSTNSWDPAVEILDNCGLPQYYWRAKTAASAPSSNPTGVAQGNVCYSPGSQSPCYSSAGGGQYYNYATCQCE